mmetsp:Transcript_3594/g.4750  ORF Transcript_3594/g.4750 Transcript_3594/m.4750 type:complete len:274 (+) Transcript_3594:147-968(+)
MVEFHDPKFKTKALVFVMLFMMMLCKITMTEASSADESEQTVLVIGAANGWTNWSAVEAFAEGRWKLQYADLEGFGDTMQKEGFQAALNQWDSKLSQTIKLLQPCAVLVCSKGLNVLTHLAKENVWTGPSVLLSPIPNDCLHNPGDSWESQWASSMDTLFSEVLGPIVIGVGTSLDEETLIVDMMEETQVCGSIDRTQYPKTFEKCPSWSLYSFPGDHSWNKNIANAPDIALLIDEALKNSMTASYISGLLIETALPPIISSRPSSTVCSKSR